MSRLILALVTASTLTGCVRARSIGEPIAGAVEVTLPDSARYLIDAVEHVIAAEGIRIELSDRTRGLVESDLIDIGAVRSTVDRSTYSEQERIVRFRFWVRPTFGGTRLTGEVVYRPAGDVIGGRAMERMVPQDHAGREVLARWMALIDKRAREEREKREKERRQAQPPAS